MERAVQNILDNMRDTDDPIEGAVFEKAVEVSFEDFCVFINVNGIQKRNNGNTERKRQSDLSVLQRG